MRRLVARLVLLGAAFGLWQWQQALAAERAEARHQRHRIGRLVSTEEQEGMVVAALSLERGDERWLYGRLAGLWRNVDYHRAAASESAIASLVDALLLGEGVVQSDDPERFADYGIGTDDGWRVILHGPDVLTAPDRDEQLVFEVGLPVEGLDGCFVKRADRDVVWALDTDPSALLGSAPAGQPPLLEPTLLPASWPGSGQGVRSVFVERRWDGEAFGLDLRLQDLTPQQLQQRMSPYTWVMQRPEGETETLPMLATAYNLFLRRVRWDEIVDASRARELGLDLPAAVLRLVPQPADGSPPEVVTLLVGSPDGQGRVPVFSSLTETLHLVDESLVTLLAPRAAELLPGAQVNPWDTFMRAMDDAQPQGLPGFGRPGR